MSLKFLKVHNMKQSKKYFIEMAIFKARNTEYGIRNTEYGIWNTEYGIRNMEYGIGKYSILSPIHVFLPKFLQ